MRIISLLRFPLFAFVLLSLSAASFAQISVSVSFAPPELPVYEPAVSRRWLSLDTWILGLRRRRR